MGKATLSRNTKLIVGGSGWLADLTDDYNGLTITDVVSAPGEPAAGRYWIEKNLTSYDRGVTVDTLYYGDGTKAMQERSEGVALAVAGSGWHGGLAGWQGLPSTAPVDQVLTNNVSLLSREPWASGLNVAEFEFSSGDVSANLPAFTNSQVCYLAVTDKNVSGSRVVTISDGSDTVTESFATPGVVPINLSGLANSVAAGTISVASLAGDSTIAGVIVFGSLHNLPDGRA